MTRYYRRAVTIIDAEELGGAMTESSAELFEETAQPMRAAQVGNAPHRDFLRIFISSAFFAFCFAASASDKPKDIPGGIQAIQIQARKIENFKLPAHQGMRLEWMGGLDLFSGAKGFGGFSALALGKDGREVTAVSDAGLWLRFDLETNGEIPIGVKNASLAPLLDAQGKSMAGQPRGDAESLAIFNGEAFVGFERVISIWRYPLGREGLQVIPAAVPVPIEVRQLRRLRGLERSPPFLVSSRYSGALLAIAEKPVRGEDNIRAWIVEGVNFRRLTIMPHDDYLISDAAFIDSGALLLLERRFVPPFGISCRIRHVQSETISGGARLDGKVIFEAGLGNGIDNMEGIAAHKGADGATYVTLLSDDNFNIFQRTLSLRFRLIED